MFTVYCRALDLGRLLPMGLLRAVLQVRAVRTSEVDCDGREYCDIFSPRIIGSQESHTIICSHGGMRYRSSVTLFHRLH